MKSVHLVLVRTAPPRMYCVLRTCHLTWRCRRNSLRRGHTGWDGPKPATGGHRDEVATQDGGRGGGRRPGARSTGALGQGRWLGSGMAVAVAVA